MASKKKPLTAETPFLRSLSAEKDEKEISIVIQPYVSGFYMAGSVNGSSFQDGYSHSAFFNWAKKIKSKLEADGFKVETSESTLGRFLDASALEILNS